MNLFVPKGPVVQLRETGGRVEVLQSEDQGVAYVIVNEAGASVYSTSQLGREEFPEYDATLRGAVSIGRRHNRWSRQ